MEELNQIEDMESPISNLISKKEKAFVTGNGADITSDEDWNAFLQTLKDAGIAEYAQIVQTAYERQKG